MAWRHACSGDMRQSQAPWRLRPPQLLPPPFETKPHLKPEGPTTATNCLLLAVFKLKTAKLSYMIFLVTNYQWNCPWGHLLFWQVMPPLACLLADSMSWHVDRQAGSHACAEGSWDLGRVVPRNTASIMSQGRTHAVHVHHGAGMHAWLR